MAAEQGNTPDPLKDAAESLRHAVKALESEEATLAAALKVKRDQRKALAKALTTMESAGAPRRRGRPRKTATAS